eukprot:Pompholyxophrys_sp_v1_NODE_100_length_1991_cov_2.120351.p1 type:complete len:300 gc:universal NODE_100_length_1991_cov_2.120351:1775-876(-)
MVLSAQLFHKNFEIVDVPPHGNCLLLALCTLLPDFTAQGLRALASNANLICNAFGTLGGFELASEANPDMISLKIYNPILNEMQIIQCESLDEFVHLSSLDRTYLQDIHIGVLSFFIPNIIIWTPTKKGFQPQSNFCLAEHDHLDYFVHVNLLHINRNHYQALRVASYRAARSLRYQLVRRKNINRQRERQQQQIEQRERERREREREMEREQREREQREREQHARREQRRLLQPRTFVGLDISDVEVPQLDIGKCVHACSSCSAIFWEGEKLSSSTRTRMDFRKNKGNSANTLRECTC